MRKGILFSLLSLIAIVSVACGGGNNATGNNAPKGNASNTADGAADGKTDGAADGKTDGGTTSTVDAYALYKKQGRTWTHKSTSKMGDTTTVSYMQYEVTKVGADSATLKTTMLDENKKPNQYVPPSETEIKFTTTTTDGTTAPKVETKEEKVNVMGKDWDAIVVEMDNNGMKTKSWSSKEYPGLLLKSTTTGETAGMKMDTTMELVEWKD